MEFMIPYEPESLYIDERNVFDVKSHQTLMERVQTEGPGFLDCYIQTKLKKQRKLVKRELERAKASGS